MIYVRLFGIVIVLSIGSSLCAMQKTLKDLALEAILHDNTGGLALAVEEKENGVYNYPFEIRQLVKLRHLNENLTGFWQTIPTAIPLFKRTDRHILRGLAFLGTSKYAMSATKKGSLFVWDTEEIKYDDGGRAVPVAVHSTGHDELSSMAVSVDGKYFATVSGSQVDLWMVGMSIALPFGLRGSCKHPRRICMVSFNGPDAAMVTGDIEGYIYIWNPNDFENPEKVIEPYIRFNGPDCDSFKRVLALRLCSDGKTFLSAGYTPVGDCMLPVIRISERATGMCTKEIVLDCKTIIGKVSFIDDTHVLTSFTSGDLLMTDIALGTTRTVHFEDLSLEASVFSDDGRHLLTVGKDHRAILWQWGKDYTYEKIKEFKGDGLIMNHGAFRADGNVFLMGSSIGALDMWSVTQEYNQMTLEMAQCLTNITNLVAHLNAYQKDNLNE